MQKTYNTLHHLNKEVVSDIKGFQLDAYLIALEGWRRGLILKWYKDETEQCTLHRLNSSTHGKFFSLSSDKRTHYFFRSRGDMVSNEAVRLCQNKEKTKQYLAKRKVPVPLGEVFKIKDRNAIITYAKKIGFPVIVKPVSGSMGKGVFTDIKSADELKEVLSILKSTLKYTNYLVEKFYPGQEYRVYVVGDQVIGAMNRLPANITGNGTNTISELIEMKNKARKKNPYLQRKPIKVDYEISQTLKTKGYQLDTVLEKGEIIYLRNISNLSAGGDPISASHELSNKVKKVAVKALKALPSIPQGGVDIIVDPLNNKKCVVLEINATAEISFHPFPLEGEPQDVPAAIIDYYFPETTKNKKTSFYFDFPSILEPLKSWVTDEIKVSQPIEGEVYGKRYVVEGKVVKVGYMNRMKREALQRNLYGYAKQIDKSKIEMIIYGTDRDELEAFYKICKKGSKKSKVTNVVSEDLVINEPIKMGFDVISQDSNK